MASWCVTSPAQPELAECLRISIGTREDMDAVVEALERILGESGKVRSEKREVER